MARQSGPIFFTGTVGDLIFYKLGDNYYIRMKGSYNTKALQKPGARPLMQLKQKEFGLASELSSQVYRQLPRAEKKQGLFGQFTKTARQLLKTGYTPEEVKAQLLETFVLPVKPAAIVATALPDQKQVQSKPVQKKKDKKVAPIKLSGWKISEKGRLTKEVAEKHKKVATNDIGQVLHIMKGYCGPCVFNGLGAQLRYKDDG